MFERNEIRPSIAIFPPVLGINFQYNSYVNYLDILIERLTILLIRQFKNKFSSQLTIHNIMTVGSEVTVFESTRQNDSLSNIDVTRVY